MPRSLRSLAHYARSGTFRAERHADLLARESGAPSAELRRIQAAYQQAGSEAERRELAREFERETVAYAASVVDAPLGELVRDMAPHEFAAEYLMHTKGSAAGSRFVFEPFQRRAVDELYRRDADGRRLFKLALFGVSRGNGKSPLAACLSLYELLRQPDAPEIYCIAGNKDQAGIVHRYAKGFVEADPRLASAIRVQDDRLIYPATNGTMVVLPSVGVTAHGKNPTVSIVDEVWLFESERQRELWTALVTASHKRPDSYVLAITTAAASSSSLLAEMLDDLHGSLELEQEDGLTVGRDEANGVLLWWHGAPAGADADDPKVWRAANPASWVSERDLRQLRNAPGVTERDFKRLHLNMHDVEPEDALVTRELWDACRAELEIPAGGEIFAAAEGDYARRSVALVWAHRAADGRVVVRSRIWSAGEDERVDYSEVEQAIVDLAAGFKLRRLAVDPSVVLLDTRRVRERCGVTPETVHAGSAAAKQANRLLYATLQGERLAHNDDRDLREHFLGARGVWGRDETLDIYRREQAQRVDGLYAAAVAVSLLPDPDAGGEAWLDAWVPERRDDPTQILRQLGLV
jgi:phage terminase large subunit-like protein